MCRLQEVSLGDFLCIPTPNTGQLNSLFRTFGEFRLIVNRIVAWQSTNWLAVNAQFSPNVWYLQKHKVEIYFLIWQNRLSWKLNCVKEFAGYFMWSNSRKLLYLCKGQIFKNICKVCNIFWKYSGDMIEVYEVNTVCSESASIPWIEP